MSGLAEIENRLKTLRKQKVDVTLRNKKAVIAEEEKNSGRRVYSMADDGENTSKAQKSQEEDVVKLAHYSIREYEKWEAKKLGSKEHRSTMGDFQTIARNSYKREVEALPASISHPLNVGITEKRKVQVEDNPELINSVVSTLNEQSKKKYMVRKHKLDKQNKVNIDDGFINNKNKRFNARLNNEFK
ncbi:unnamed protein product [Kluyveromyces dobzhanskii CBS 2104]|uniref:Pre-mRNA-splicing factor SYF2 n=1 Tax=Kluyveromyces dobzhanskii CBS 2104 TaxID=1427455 RepID=A0A0A8L5J6_9SACH|nr:unnamed protein product [Kluyveromyces dobzhanskii CBS 2104]